MILGELIQRIQSLYSKGVQSDDSRLSSRHIYSKIVTVRSTLLSQKSKNKQKISDWNFQTLSCIEMIDVKPHECPCAPYPDCSTIKRSKHKIPKIMSDYNGNLIDYVMSIDGSKRFDYTNRNELMFIKGNKYTSTSNRYILDKDYIYLYGRDTPKVIQMRALFDDPIEAMEFESLCPSQNDESCSDIFQMEFPFDSTSIDTFVQLTVQELITFFGQRPQDDRNDGQDSGQQQQA